MGSEEGGLDSLPWLGGIIIVLNRDRLKVAGTWNRLENTTTGTQIKGEIVLASNICTHFLDKVAFALVSIDG